MNENPDGTHCLVVSLFLCYVSEEVLIYRASLWCTVKASNTHTVKAGGLDQGMES
jgi:hypothetical protein